MPFQDVIDDYSNGATGTLTASNGIDTVNYTIVSNANTVTTPNTDQGARITANGQQQIEVTFDQPVNGITLSFDRSNTPEIYRIQIDGVEVNIQDLIDNGDAVFTTTNAVTGDPGTHVVQDGGITSTGSFSNDSLGFLTLNVPVTQLTVFGSGGTGSNFDIVEIGIDSANFTVVCFAEDTDIATPDGPRQVSTLKAGDQVVTLDGETRTIVATNARHVLPLELFRETRLLPVRIAAGALGGGLPTRDLRVSRQHRILFASRIARRIFGQQEVLIPAFRLVGLPGITVDRAIGHVTYHHILLDRHDVVLANGAPAETLFVGPMSAQALQDELDDTVREVVIDNAEPMTPARPFPTAHDAKRIVNAHIKQQRPILETRFCQPA